MANTTNDWATTYSSYIGQKLFAYISKGKDINNRIKEKFKKSLIFISDEHQIYQPLTDTYIGIAYTSYLASVDSIKSAHDKVDALNKALTSSMVTSIYANWTEEQWNKLTEDNSGGYNSMYGPENAKGPLSNLIKSKIYATNDIVIKGVGDYDPKTGLSSSYELPHVTDNNYAKGSEERNLLDSAYFLNKASNRNAWATSGITVSLEKGLNKYMFTWKKSETESETVEFTAEQWNDVADKAAYTAVFSDNAPVNADILGSYHLFKQSTNTLLIDDKLTWSYISSSYSYTLDFSKRYTDNQVARIYTELLGENTTALIPVSIDQVRDIVLNEGATLNKDNKVLTWNGSQWEWVIGSDGAYEGSDNLSNYALNKGSIYAVEAGTNVSDVKALIPTIKGDETYLPWFVLRTIAQKVEQSIALDTTNASYQERLTTALSNVEVTWKVCTGKDAEGNKIYEEYEFSGEGKDWDKVYFLNYERSVKYNALVTINNKALNHDDLLDNNTMDKTNVWDKSESTLNIGDGREIIYKGGLYYKLIDNLSDITDAENDASIKDLNSDINTVKLYVVNTKFIPTNSDINLKDGIQTLKEVAHILDAITDGLGSSDAESNGILLTYNIADNHRRIQDLNKRLEQVEGGKNVVKSIRKDEDLTSDLVGIQFTSDVSWKIDHTKYSSSSDLFVTSGPLSETEEYVGVNLSEGQASELVPLPLSFIVEYNALWNTYNAWNAKYWDGVSAYVDEVGNVLEPLTEPSLVNYKGYHNIGIKQADGSYVLSNGQTVTTKPYAGNVSLGVDLKLAQISTFKEGITKENLIPVDLSSALVKKTIKVTAKVRPDLTNNPGVSYWNDTYEPNNKDKRYTSIPTIDGLNDKDKELLAEKLSALNIELKDSEGNYNSNIIFEAKWAEVIDNKSVPGDVYGAIFEIEIKITGVTDESIYYPKVLTIENNVIEPIEDNADDTKNVYYHIDDNPKLYVAYKPKEVTKAIVDEDGLTTASWVNTFVKDTVNEVSKDIKKIEIESYEFTKSLINSLDSRVIANRDKVIIGIEQKNGIVTPIVRDLPKDELLASYTVWGESDLSQVKYTPITSTELYNEATQYEPLYIAPTNTYNYVQTINSAETPVATDSTELANIFYFSGGKYYPVSGVNTEEIDFKQQLVSSYNLGNKYEWFIPVYKQVQAYIQIDPAKLSYVDGDFKYHFGETNYTANNSQIYKKAPVEEEEKREYISATMVHKVAEDGGTGGNSMKVTAHITKISDATEKNSGLVDAYDVRETINNLFEWVDLSLYTGGDINPMNTPANEDE